MREADKYYEQAFTDAWSQIQEKLELTKAQLNVASVRLERISYARDSFVSHIEELAEEPKSPHPDQIKVKVGVEAVYRIVEEPVREVRSFRKGGLP